ncbi:hypothetical protein NEOLEDRAFT_1152240 [Neolentinus lepideus HHB14362 ss-1]|uniref:ABC transmembrane type-1 domain-containing protein n=1 Tax=Neolentinus lepideus HHB14362 ss-1 TaxID=1314782 RepID=A0A165MZA5_9AGAM|nr:hypothetical protein NEOLEDRAFT_1152240 [Neolentinus lepideus HHB14362 ss-1]
MVEELHECGLLHDLTSSSLTLQDTEEAEAEKEKTEEDLAAEVKGSDGSRDLAVKTGEKRRPRKLVEDEHRETGGVKWSIYNTYLKASSYWTWAILVVLILFMECGTQCVGMILPLKDIATVDSAISYTLQDVNTSLASVFASAITVFVIFPLFLIPAFALGLVYHFLIVRYLHIGHDLRQMESNSFGELLDGIVTMRAFSTEQQFLDELHSKIDFNIKMSYMIWMMNRWLLLNFEILSAGAVLVTTLFSLLGLVSAGIAGICITSAMNFTGSIYWACHTWTSLELDLKEYWFMFISSVERVVEYLNLPQEPPALLESNRPPAYWPSSSNQYALMSVEDLVIKYAPDLPPVLYGISFQLQSGECIGLLGRTSSGKSTLAMSILRFTFIPQDAILFSRTLWDNLDPFNEHMDEECLDVLYGTMCR